MDAAKLTRPTSLAEMRERFQRFRTPEGTKRALAFKPRPSDVFVATYPKSGTTWMQQIVHGLRTGGSMAFDEITEVVPWIEMGFDMGIDIEAEQFANPRAFKSHMNWEDLPKGGRNIYVIRDPKDVVVSFYNFMIGWYLEPGSVSFETFVNDQFCVGSRSGRYWEHVLSWWPTRGRDDCLLVAYEDLKETPRAQVMRVAEFIGLDASDETIDIATRQSGFDFMKAHEHQFDDHLVAQTRDEICGIPPGGASSKLGSGGVRPQLTSELDARLDEIWAETIGSELGFADYSALRGSLNTAS